MFPRQTEFLWTRVRRRLARVMLASRSCVSTGPPQKLSPLENSELKTKSPVSKLFNAIKPDYIKLYLMDNTTGLPDLVFWIGIFLLADSPDLNLETRFEGGILRKYLDGGVLPRPCLFISLPCLRSTP